MSLPEQWDCIVVGAGCAGAIVAREIRRRRASVLLVDREVFPRYKVCGGCLGAAAVQMLQDIGIDDLSHKLLAPELRLMRWRNGRDEAVIDLPGGISVSRHALDQHLVQHACAAGVEFRDDTSASLTEVDDAHAWVDLKTANGVRRAGAKLVIAADGLAGSFLSRVPTVQTTIARQSRMGFGAMIADAGSICPAGEIHMYSAAGGYVGLVQVEAGALNVAAAMDHRWVRRLGSVDAAVQAIVKDPAVTDALRSAGWKGTAFLTRSRKPLGARRVLLLGDSCSYVEPFTGEGMTWAIASALALGEIARRAIGAWDDRIISRWTRRHGELLGQRQRICRAIATGLRHHVIAATTLQLARHVPSIARKLVGHVHSPIGVA